MATPSSRMLLGDLFQHFVKDSPICFMTRLLLENALNPQTIDSLFAQHAERQYTRELLFSSVVEVMGLVVCGMQPSVNAAYKKLKERIPVARKNLYEKINHTEPAVAAALLRHTAAQMTTIVQHLGGALPDLLPGYRVRILDGNCLAATEHRLKPLRTTTAGPLPGKSLVVLDPALMLAVDVFPCLDGHAQERALLDQVLPTVAAGDLWIEDRNFCTRRWLLGVAARGACFLVREHKANAPWQAETPLRYKRRADGARVWEQRVRITDPETGQQLRLRRLVLKLAQPTRDGEYEVVLLTNLPRRQAAALKVACLYRKRWTIETLFQVLEQAFASEQARLGYPQAALLSFCVALVAYNLLAVVKAALRVAQGTDKVEREVSLYYFAEELSGVYRGMMIALPEERWTGFQTYTPQQMAELLTTIAAQVRLSAYGRQPRGPKKPRPPRTKNKGQPHVSTQRLLREHHNMKSHTI